MDSNRDSNIHVTEIPLFPDQVCQALDNFCASQPGDLGFVKGDKLVIIRESEMMFWYIAKNEQGQVGTVPGTHLRSLGPPPIPEKGTSIQSPTNTQPNPDYYEKMSDAPSPLSPTSNKEERQMMSLMEKDKRRRLPSKTLLVAIGSYRSNTPGDLNFKFGDEMVVIKPTKDLCWYMVHIADDPSKRGVIPLTHVRPVYMSDEDEDDRSDLYQTPKKCGHNHLYEDKNDFIANSGWFAQHGHPLVSKDSLKYSLAYKIGIDFDKFMSIKQAVYMLQYMNEKTFVGKAEVLHVELSRHFDSFGMQRKNIKEIDDDLCHHTTASGWKIKIWEVKENENIELIFAQKVIGNNSLYSNDGGLTESMSFSNMDTFETFWKWLSPNC